MGPHGPGVDQCGRFLKNGILKHTAIKDGDVLLIYTGIHDGHTGSVPISQSINFYNKVLKEMGADDPAALVSEADASHMLQNRTSPWPDKDLGKIAGRKILYQNQYKSIKLLIFEGTHELLPAAGLDGIADK